ncbi:DMT family transporter [Ferrovibrio sp.]|uniref:DMT family transporter n=1 Tax=Ferrovibrio sp. TaxID=1917215 RepID=UPI0025BC371C|nr:DMT family transporter [Ferrovibrio sp.]MBX3454062.1 DMT family transporter [Ferrovibrio sp.]
MKTNTRLDSLAIIILAICSVVWGTQQVVIKLTTPDVSPLLQAGLRSGGGAILVLLWMLWKRIEVFPRDGTLWPGLLVGLLFAVEFALFYTGVQYTLASRAGILLYTAPFWVVLGAHWLIPGERIKPIQLVGLLAAFGGLLVAFKDSLHLPNPDELLGDGMVLLAGLAWGATTLAIKTSKLARIDAARTLFYQLAYSAPLLFGLSLLLNEEGVRVWSGFVIGSLAFQIVGIAFISYLIWFWLLRNYPAGRLSAFSFLTPLMSVVVSLLWLNEPFTPTLAAALLLVGGGIYMVNRP